MIGTPGSRRAAMRAFLLSAIAAWPARAADPPPADPFYVPPEPLPDGKPGDLLRSRESTFTTDSQAQAPATDVRAFQVLYRSTNALGAPDAVSGTVLVPRAPFDGTRPIVGYAVGTQGMGDVCAASVGLSTGSSYEAGFVRALLDRGWAVAVSDYEGLGTPGDHTYVVNLSLGHAVLDAVRAATALADTGLDPAAPVVLFGYSEGGGASAAAAELAASYAPELSIRALASGAAPADLARVAAYEDGQIGFGSVFIAGLGFDAAYPELHLSDGLNDLGKTEAAWARDACIADIVGRFASHRMSDYTIRDPMESAAFRARLEENHLGKAAPAFPVYLYHGETDEVIPLAVGEALRDAYCARGASVTWKTYPGAEHILGQAQGFAAAADWLAERLNGVEAESVCPPLPPGGGADGGAAGSDAVAGAGSSGGCAVSRGGARGPSRVPGVAALAVLGAGIVLGARRRARAARAGGLAGAAALGALLAACGASSDGAAAAGSGGASSGGGPPASGGAFPGSTGGAAGASSPGGAGGAPSGPGAGGAASVSGAGGASSEGGSAPGGASASGGSGAGGVVGTGGVSGGTGGAPGARMTAAVNVHDYPKPTAYGYTAADGADRMGDGLASLGVTAVRGPELGSTTFLTRLHDHGVTDTILGLSASAFGKPFDPSKIGPALEKSLAVARSLGMTVEVEGLNEWDLFHSRAYNAGVRPAGMTDQQFVGYTQQALYEAAHPLGIPVIGPSVGHGTDAASLAYFPDVSAWVDIVNLHAYFTSSPETVDLAALVVSHAAFQGAGKPVWVTETGISSYGGVDATAQADVMRRGLGTYAASGLVARLYVYELLDDHQPGWDGTTFTPDSAEYHFGLFSFAGAAKAAAAPFRDYVSAP